MKLRRLEIKDMYGMLEWMKNNDIVQSFQINFIDFNEEKVIKFIENSYTEHDIHFAIADDCDEYMGTISLKNINKINKNAEYAIVLRNEAIGSGLAKLATNKILEYAFNELHLNKVYLNVYSDNIRAIKFYEKMDFTFEGEFKKHIFKNGQFKNIKWFSIFNGEVDYEI